jgi:hypothetical protein
MLRSDLVNFDKIFLANTLIDSVYSKQLEFLERDHIEIFLLCCGDKSEFVP